MVRGAHAQAGDGGEGDEGGAVNVVLCASLMRIACEYGSARVNTVTIRVSDETAVVAGGPPADKS